MTAVTEDLHLQKYRRKHLQNRIHFNTESLIQSVNTTTGTRVKLHEVIITTEIEIQATNNTKHTCTLALP
jgi:hypothetical protein